MSGLDSSLMLGMILLLALGMLNSCGSGLTFLKTSSMLSTFLKFLNMSKGSFLTCVLAVVCGFSGILDLKSWNTLLIFSCILTSLSFGSVVIESLTSFPD
ncbi:hypothetical protein WICPIJ_000959 [Wickerhamomyces pijperi]|uniref:Uncharacterized protein n=1 Tax=Wickerhamomyces pijperi TaxID=599730 RepID=A0A9P8TR35_WICPI|nr:hypothetical protein WICPIJ_000959 [Wickerhamomyces pijperi]